MWDDVRALLVNPEWKPEEVAWLARERKKAVERTEGRSQYVPHQGRRERARRLARRKGE
jgi:hypothetical protein